jgi:hypothetical protein
VGDNANFWEAWEGRGGAGMTDAPTFLLPAAPLPAPLRFWDVQHGPTALLKHRPLYLPSHSPLPARTLKPPTAPFLLASPSILCSAAAQQGRGKKGQGSCSSSRRGGAPPPPPPPTFASGVLSLSATFDERQWSQRSNGGFHAGESGRIAA